jgi:hypothetical protein
VPRVSIHVVRIDVLLWSLGGFSEPPEESCNPQALSVNVVNKIRELSSGDRILYGRRKAIAADLGISPGSLSVLLSRARHGIEPAYWGPR